MIEMTFLRHGDIISSDENEDMEKINFADLSAFKLSKTGISQVEDAGNQLADQKFDVIVCGTSRRTIESAFIVTKKIKHPHKFICDPGIDAWKANKHEDFISAGDYWKRYFQFAKCNGEADAEENSWETFQELSSRTYSALQKYESFNRPLIIAHSIVISLYVGLPRGGIEYGKFYTTKTLSPKPPNFQQYF